MRKEPQNSRLFSFKTHRLNVTKIYYLLLKVTVFVSSFFCSENICGVNYKQKPRAILLQILSKVWFFLRVIFVKLGPYFKYIQYVIQVVNFLKRTASDPAFDYITAITESSKDNEALHLIRIRLANAVTSLEIVDQCLNEKTIEAQIKCFVDAINKQPKTIREAIYLKLASELVKREYKGISQAEADTMVQLAFIKTKREKAA